MKILIFGVGYWGEVYYKRCKKRDDLTVAAFVDNDSGKIGNYIESIPIISPLNISDIEFDKIVIAISNEEAVSEISQQLINCGIDKEKIERLTYSDLSYYDEYTDIRVIWTKNFSHYAYERNMAGNVAECGVFAGDFSIFINKYFYDKKLYLFDTFNGFDKRDLKAETELGQESFSNGVFAEKPDMFDAANVESVMRKMPIPDNCIIKQGYFPQTAIDVQDSFCFVNLDMDLYQPMLAALHFFWEKMVLDGILLLHDYFHPDLPGVKKAVEDFEKELQRNVCKMPIGDFCSIALIKD